MIHGTRRERTITWDDPLKGLDAIRSSHGLDYLRALKDGALPMPAMYALVNAAFEEIDFGRVVMTGVPGEEYSNLLGTVHAGFIMAMLDSAMGSATMSTLSRGTVFITMSFASNFVTMVNPGTSLVRCVGEVVHRGSRVITARAVLSDCDGALCAHALASCLLREEHEFSIKGSQHYSAT